MAQTRVVKGMSPSRVLTIRHPLFSSTIWKDPPTLSQYHVTDAISLTHAFHGLGLWNLKKKKKKKKSSDNRAKPTYWNGTPGLPSPPTASPKPGPSEPPPWWHSICPGAPVKNVGVILESSFLHSFQLKNTSVLLYLFGGLFVQLFIVVNSM